jgi:hypothetical protein
VKIIFRIILVLVCLAVLVSLFYAEENWRGKRAWENCKRELEAKGAVLDWNAYIPSPVPDDQNFFKAPKMQQWFVKNWRSDTNELAGRLRSADTVATITNKTEAVKYLAWSDQFKPDFDLIRDALKRPYARIDGDYSAPFEIPEPDFVNVRLIAQTLAQRAKCYLLLGQPEKALDELTLLNDSRRLLEAAPTGKPMTLITAMINVAITGLYLNTIADGLRSNAWREPQLVALQEQVKEINLPPILASAFDFEAVCSCRVFETGLLRKFPNDPSLWKEVIQHFRFPVLRLMPRGWIYQNMVTVVRLDYMRREGFDLDNGIILPNKVESVSRRVEMALNSSSPYSFLADDFIPNFSKAFQTLAYNQTLANETQIVCALKRYHLAHDEHPETLDALAPLFIEKLPRDTIGGQPLHYRRTTDGKFLLYSVGWNETDDGGQVALKKDGSEDREQGDWVWKN